jgi:hypothetical protein
MRATGSLSLSANIPARLVPPSDHSGSPVSSTAIKKYIYENKHNFARIFARQENFSKILIQILEKTIKVRSGIDSPESIPSDNQFRRGIDSWEKSREDPRMQCIPALKISIFWSNFQLDFTLGYYPIPGIDFSSHSTFYKIRAL